MESPAQLQPAFTLLKALDPQGHFWPRASDEKAAMLADSQLAAAQQLRAAADQADVVQSALSNHYRGADAHAFTEAANRSRQSAEDTAHRLIEQAHDNHKLSLITQHKMMGITRAAGALVIIIGIFAIAAVAAPAVLMKLVPIALRTAIAIRRILLPVFAPSDVKAIHKLLKYPPENPVFFEGKGLMTALHRWGVKGAFHGSTNKLDVIKPNMPFLPGVNGTKFPDSVHPVVCASDSVHFSAFMGMRRGLDCVDGIKKRRQLLSYRKEDHPEFLKREAYVHVLPLDKFTPQKKLKLPDGYVGPVPPQRSPELRSAEEVHPVAFFKTDGTECAELVARLIRENKVTFSWNDGL